MLGLVGGATDSEDGQTSAHLPCRQRNLTVDTTITRSTFVLLELEVEAGRHQGVVMVSHKVCAWLHGITMVVVGQTRTKKVFCCDDMLRFRWFLSPKF